jgi:hypothetical protein
MNDSHRVIIRLTDGPVHRSPCLFLPKSPSLTLTAGFSFLWTGANRTGSANEPITRSTHRFKSVACSITTSEKPREIRDDQVSEHNAPGGALESFAPVVVKLSEPDYESSRQDH